MKPGFATHNTEPTTGGCMEECKIVSLGWCIARLTVRNAIPSLTIMSPSLYDSDQSEPASSISIYGVEAVKELANILAPYA